MTNQDWRILIEKGLPDGQLDYGCPKCSYYGGGNDPATSWNASEQVCYACGFAITHKIVNLLPHAITVDNVRYNPSGVILRVPMISPVEQFKVNGTTQVVHLVADEDTTVELPPSFSGVFYVVSRQCAEHYQRPDFLVVHDTIRNTDGNIVGARSFAIINRGEVQ